MDGLAFLAAMALALAVSYAIGYLIALLSFWFLTTLHFEWTVGAFVTVFSGAFLPLWFFPAGWARLARALPFQYLGYVPAAIYLGRISPGDLLPTLALGAGWAVVLLGITYGLWSAAMRRLVVQGG